MAGSARVDWIVSTSAGERARGELAPHNLFRALVAMRRHGVVLLKGAFRRDFVRRLQREFEQRHGHLTAAQMRRDAEAEPPNRLLGVGDKRYERTLEIRGPLASAALFENGMVCQITRTLLGSEVQLNSFTAVVSYPGARFQHIHKDAPTLFGDLQLQADIPPFAINALVPLIDVGLDIGPTGFWPGSHRWITEKMPAAKTIAAEPLKQGDCLLLDYRVWHAGMPNRSRKVRPILYMVYARPWFIDEGNHRYRIPVNIALEDYVAAPESLRSLLVRGYSYALRSLDTTGG